MSHPSLIGGRAHAARVVLHGLVMPVAPVLVLFDLQSRGFDVSAPGGRLVVEPTDQLSSEDCTRATAWRGHLILLTEDRRWEGPLQ